LLLLIFCEFWRSGKDESKIGVTACAPRKSEAWFHLSLLEWSSSGQFLWAVALVRS
jgi:hypothetical protein